MIAQVLETISQVQKTASMSIEAHTAISQKTSQLESLVCRSKSVAAAMTKAEHFPGVCRSHRVRKIHLAHFWTCCAQDR